MTSTEQNGASELKGEAVEKSIDEAEPQEDTIDLTAASEETKEDNGNDDFQPMPDDLNDFVVVDEAEITDPEDENGEDGLLDEVTESVQWDCPADRLAPRTYTDRDFRPTIRDPRCKDDWVLGTFWPVYVGNFRLFGKYGKDYNCAHSIHKYFASKGIPSFVVFRLKNNFFKEYQQLVGLYDLLVYFCCEKDANRAIQWCHRDLYYGYKLNVYSGRKPVYFASHKSWRFEHVKTEDKLEIESNMEQYFRRFGEVVSISKQDLNGVYVQFKTKLRLRDDQDTFQNDRFKGKMVVEKVQRQRFVEQDVEAEILKAIAESPQFFRSRPRRSVMVSLMHGVIPEMFRNWEHPELMKGNKRAAVPPARLDRTGPIRKKVRRLEDRAIVPDFKRPATNKRDFPVRGNQNPALSNDRRRMKDRRQRLPFKYTRRRDFDDFDYDKPQRRPRRGNPEVARAVGPKLQTENPMPRRIRRGRRRPKIPLTGSNTIEQ
ncbi:uncharacterized protein LOC131685623 [Topomyia yanbarensis]|uniref:uncharacterized protein LOC131685623 n=1 Tax=Topomyia yanbarensis TaxID=2498891 RepID=UPI00273C7423|nr:uncharacterized protein LOC131685623 [Topomyia yanbarensis]